MIAYSSLSKTPTVCLSYARSLHLRRLFVDNDAELESCWTPLIDY